MKNAKHLLSVPHPYQRTSTQVAYECSRNRKEKKFLNLPQIFICNEISDAVKGGVERLRGGGVQQRLPRYRDLLLHTAQQHL